MSNHEEQKYHSPFYTMILEMLLENGHLTDENILHLIIENNSADYVMLFKYENNYTQLLQHNWYEVRVSHRESSI